MKAIQIEQTGGPEVLNYVDIDAPQPGAGQITVRHGAIGVNFIDCYFRSGLYPRPTPFVLGREGAGTVAALGAGVTGLSVGDRVVYADDATPGSYAEIAAIAAGRVIRIPDGVDDAVACAAMVQGLTAHYLSHDTAPLKPGMTCVVHAAAGGVGQLLVQYAKQLGATVIATCSTAKLDLVRGHGADHVIDYTTQDFAAETKRIAPGGVDAVYDSVGKDTWERSMTILRPRGTLVFYGASSGPVPPLDVQKLAGAGSIFVTRPTLVHYVIGDELQTRAAAVLGDIAAGRLKVTVQKRYPLAEAAQAQRDLEGRKTTGKLVLVP